VSRSFLVELSALTPTARSNKKDNGLERSTERFILCQVLSELGYEVDNQQVIVCDEIPNHNLLSNLTKRLEEMTLGAPTDCFARITSHGNGFMVNLLY